MSPPSALRADLTGLMPPCVSPPTTAHDACGRSRASARVTSASRRPGTATTAYGYGSDGRGREPGSPQDAPKPPTNIQPTRAQSQALQHCVIDFADQNAFPTQQLIAGAGYGSLNSSANWMVDDDADSVYQSTAISYRGAFNSTNWKTVNGRAYREVPRDVPERIRNVVRTARRSKVPTDGRGARHEMAALRWLLRYFTESGFQYSLEAPGSSAQGNLQAISDFLRTKRGYCVHYATAFALLARMMGVATRVDLGYSSASSPVNSGADSVPEYATTQNQLHSWVEAYIDGIGWIPFDVTPGYTGAAARNRPGSVSEKDVQKARSQGNRQTGGSSSTADSDTTDSERSGSSDALNDTSRPSRDQQGSRRSETAHGPRDSTAPRTSRARTGAQDADSPSQAWSVLRLAAGILALLILLAALALAFPPSAPAPEEAPQDSAPAIPGSPDVRTPKRPKHPEGPAKPRSRARAPSRPPEVLDPCLAGVPRCGAFRGSASARVPHEPDDADHLGHGRPGHRAGPVLPELPARPCGRGASHSLRFPGRRARNRADGIG